MRNFDFLQDITEFKTLYGHCFTAEEKQAYDPDYSAIASRRALEYLVKTIYARNEYVRGENWDLHQMINDEQFQNFLGHGYEIRERLKLIRKVGNKSAHEGGVRKNEAYLAVEYLYSFVGMVMIRFGKIKELPKFNPSLIPLKPEPVISVAPSTDTTPKTEEIKDLPKIPTIADVPVPESNLSEEETRRLFIDVMLQEAGWQVLEEKGLVAASKACIEVKVDGMPTPSGTGYCDYVLFGADGNPLAVIEAKKALTDLNVGHNQAKLYADCLEKKYGVRPIIYVSNGYQTHIMDGIYPSRQVYGFHIADELSTLIKRRDRGIMKDLRVNDSITNRAYQKQAVKAVCEHFNNKRRKGLLVMATGTGKTRVSISLVDVLTRNAWAKNILFLADRTALVDQAKKNYSKLLPSMSFSVLSDAKGNIDKDARIMFSTYQTMINYIDDESKEFSIGRFDLIIIDEAHRSIFGRYKSILSYFDSLVVGLTATPRDDMDKSTYEMFEMEGGQPNFAYEMQDGENEGYLCRHKAFAKGTIVMREGIKYDDLSDDEKEQMESVWLYEAEKEGAGYVVPTPRNIQSNEIFNYIFNINTIDLVIQDLMENGLKINEGDTLGKTIIFAYNHQHADKIVERFNVLYPELGKDDFCQLIDNYVKFPKALIDKFELRDTMPQIAVSVDMLDVGVDVPDILNLVFFKPVKSKIKFVQMIGRGTRLSENIYGDGKDKDLFYIFDWCGNFDFFGKNPNGVEAVSTISLTAHIFRMKSEIACWLQSADYQTNEFTKALHDKWKDELLEHVRGLSDSRICVRENWQYVDKFRKQESWLSLTSTDVYDLKTHVAPLLIGNQNDLEAKRFDAQMFMIELSELNGVTNANLAKRRTINICQILHDKKANLPEVMAKMDTIKQVLTNTFWDNLTIENLEKVRTDLRDLMHIFKNEKGKIFFVKIGDEVVDQGETEVVITPITYKQRVIDYLEEHHDLPVIEKIKHIKQLDADDIKQLEQILWNELGSKNEYDEQTNKMLCGDNVAVFIRSVIGIEKQEALKIFSDLLSNMNLNSMQEEFLKTVLNYVCANGDIEGKNLMESPFKEYSPLKLFGDKLSVVGQFVKKLHDVVRA